MKFVRDHQLVGLCRRFSVRRYNMLLLLRCRESLVRRGISAGSYGEVGRAALGRYACRSSYGELGMFHDAMCSVSLYAGSLSSCLS